MKFMLLFLSLLFSGIFISAQNNTAKELRTKADQLYDSEKYEEAIPFYLEIIEKNHRDHEALQLAGIAYSKIGNSEKAKQYLRPAILYSENKSYYYSSLSGVYNDLNEFDKGYEYARKALAIEENTQSLFNAASLANNAGKASECISILEKNTISLHNDFNSLYGRCYLTLGNYRKAVEKYEFFFENYKEEEKFAEVTIKEEQKNLLRAYLAKIFSKTAPANQKLEYISKIQLFPPAIYRAFREEFFFKEINICPAQNYTSSECTELFYEVFSKDLLPEDHIKINYFLKKNFSEAFRLSDQFLKIVPEQEKDFDLQLLRYRSLLRLFLEDYKLNKRQANYKLLDDAALLFADFYEDNMDYTFAEIDANEKYSLPLTDTFNILKEDFPLLSQRKELNSYIYHIIKNIPSSELRAQINFELKNTK